MLRSCLQCTWQYVRKDKVIWFFHGMHVRADFVQPETRQQQMQHLLLRPEPRVQFEVDGAWQYLVRSTCSLSFGLASYTCTFVAFFYSVDRKSLFPLILMIESICNTLLLFIFVLINYLYTS